MSRHDYLVSRELAARHGFHALLMAAMRKADSTNLALLRIGFAAVWAELDQRYNTPGGYTVAEAARVNCSPKCPTLPTVYLWCSESFAATGDQHWLALADDGVILAGHVCSHESFAELDLHARKPDVYRRKYGGFGHGEFYHLQQIPAGDRPPDDVLTLAAEYGARVTEAVADAMTEPDDRS